MVLSHDFKQIQALAKFENYYQTRNLVQNFYIKLHVKSVFLHVFMQESLSSGYYLLGNSSIIST